MDRKFAVFVDGDNICPKDYSQVRFKIQKEQDPSLPNRNEQRGKAVDVQLVICNET